MNKRILIPLLILCALLLAACGRANRGTRIDVETHDLWYGENNDNLNNPPTWTIEDGKPAMLRIKNEGAIEHDFTILKPGVEPPFPFRETEHADLILFATEKVQKDKIQAFTLPDLEPGNYLVICSVLGHFPSMQGTLEVQ